jgi:transposase-like protein
MTPINFLSRTQSKYKDKVNVTSCYVGTLYNSIQLRTTSHYTCETISTQYQYKLNTRARLTLPLVTWVLYTTVYNCAPPPTSYTCETISTQYQYKLNTRARLTLPLVRYTSIIAHHFSPYISAYERISKYSPK